ncbi:MAG: enoyl-CoA hydratase-related protein [Lautropia sp.]
MAQQGRTAESEEAPVLVRRAGEHIGIVTLNRPRVLNAVNAEVAAVVRAAVEEFESDQRIRVGILTGSGRAFCAGADLKEFTAGRDIRVPRVGGFAGFTNTARSKPWVAALNGSAYGGGTELLLACDLAIAAAGTVIALSEVTKGLVALGGGVVRAPRRLPLAIANELLLTGEPMTAERAYELGLVNRVVPADSVLEEAIRLAGKIADASPFAVRTSLRLASQTVDLPIDEMWRLNQEATQALHESGDFKEGPRAFVEKRKPRWQDI